MAGKILFDGIVQHVYVINNGLLQQMDIATNEQQIRQRTETWAQAVRERDTDKILAFHAQDFLLFDVPPPLKSKGLEAYRKTWEELFYRYTKPGVFHFYDLQVTASEEVAFCTATMWCEDNADGLGFKPLDFRLTIGLKKIAGQWWIVHDHGHLAGDWWGWRGCCGFGFIIPQAEVDVPGDGEEDNSSNILLPGNRM